MTCSCLCYWVRFIMTDLFKLQIYASCQLPEADLLLVTVLDWYIVLLAADRVSVLLPAVRVSVLLLPEVDWFLVVIALVVFFTSVTRLLDFGDGSGLLSQSLPSDRSELLFEFLRLDLNGLVRFWNIIYHYLD